MKAGLRLFILSILILSNINNKIQAQNTDENLEVKPFQFSFLYPIGTSGFSSKDYAYNVSINMLGGYTGGVKGVEMASLFNISRNEVSGAQIAGSFNINAGYLKGAQLSGLLNVNTKTVKRAQVAGLINITADTMKGSQISGIINFAPVVTGFQLGLINVADTVDGVSIGFLNFIRKGYNRFSISTNENLFLNASVKLGTHKFYNILSTGINYTGFSKWSVGYGVGNHSQISNKLGLVTEIHTYNINEGFNWNGSFRQWYRLNSMIAFPLSQSINILAGPSLNLFLEENGSTELNEFPTYNITESASNNFNRKFWIGGNLEVLF